MYHYLYTYMYIYRRTNLYISACHSTLVSICRANICHGLCACCLPHAHCGAPKALLSVYEAHKSMCAYIFCLVTVRFFFFLFYLCVQLCHFTCVYFTAIVFALFLRFSTIFFRKLSNKRLSDCNQIFFAAQDYLNYLRHFCWFIDFDFWC